MNKTNKKFKKILPSLIPGILALTLNIATAQIPVTDGALIASNQSGIMSQLAEWGKQLDAMKEQFDQGKEMINQGTQLIDQGKELYDSVQGVRNMGNLLDSAESRKFLPEDYSKAMDLLGGGSGALAEKVKSMKEEAKSINYEENGIDITKGSGKEMDRTASVTAKNRAMATSAYDNAVKRVDKIQKLVDKVNQAPDDKDVQDLQAAIGAESAMLQNEMIMLTAQGQLQANDRAVQEQRDNEQRIEALMAPAAPFNFPKSQY